MSNTLAYFTQVNIEPEKEFTRLATEFGLSGSGKEGTKA
jgi:hypothetical protein